MEYTTNKEIRFTWNFDYCIQICKNHAPETHVNIVLPIKDLKSIRRAFGFRNDEVKLFYDGKEYIAQINNEDMEVTLVCSIQDRRKKGV